MNRNQARPINSPQIVAIGASAALSNATQVGTKYVRLAATVDCYILISVAGTTVTTTNGFILPAHTAEIFPVPGINNSTTPAVKISCLECAAGGGFLSITESAQD